MSQNRNNRFHKKNNQKHSDKSIESVIDESNPIIAVFQQISIELDDKHDRYERIVKLSRDITIESKRIIFSLHTVDLRKENAQKTLTDAKQRLDALCNNNFTQIAKELHGRDPYQYTKAYSAGLQEFIEAYTFYEYISGTELSDWNVLGNCLTYKNDASKETNEHSEKEAKKYSCLVQPVEFMLGLADMTGEVMRRGINSLGSGNLDVCFHSSTFLQQLYTGYLKIAGSSHNREMGRKISTLRQSLLKTEMVAYNIKVRGGEAAKWGSENANVNDVNTEEDEGFF